MYGPKRYVGVHSARDLRRGGERVAHAGEGGAGSGKPAVDLGVLMWSRYRDTWLPLLSGLCSGVGTFSSFPYDACMPWATHFSCLSFSICKMVIKTVELTCQVPVGDSEHWIR